MKDSVTVETDYLVRRAVTQLALADKASNPDVALVHFRMSSLYLDRARTLVDAHCAAQRRPPALVAVSN